MLSCYRPLKEVFKYDQTFCELNDIEGIIVATRFPIYMQTLNVPGWHYHFIDIHKTIGGHVLDLSIESGAVVDICR